jgi:hypothetical protein
VGATRHAAHVERSGGGTVSKDPVLAYEARRARIHLQARLKRQR